MRFIESVPDGGDTRVRQQRALGLYNLHDRAAQSICLCTTHQNKVYIYKGFPSRLLDILISLLVFLLSDVGGAVTTSLMDDIAPSAAHKQWNCRAALFTSSG